MKGENEERLHVIQSYASCDWCGARAFFSLAIFDKNEIGYDARFCIVCDRWLEGPCGSATCCYCADRPERPSEVKFRVRIVGEPGPARVGALFRTRRVRELEEMEDEDLDQDLRYPMKLSE